VSNLPEKRPAEPEPIPWRAILIAALVLYAVVFLLLNTDEVSVSFVFFTATTSLLFLILLSMGLGAAIAVFGPAFWRRRERLRRDERRPPLDDQRGAGPR
jgi:uncharacterized integral membrane protein